MMDKKISLVDAVIMFIIVLGADLFDAFAGISGFVPGVGQVIMFINWMVGLTVLAITQFWLIMKGIKGLSYLAGNLVEMIPILNILPIRTATLLVVIYMANHPKIASKVQMAKGKIAK